MTLFITIDYETQSFGLLHSEDEITQNMLEAVDDGQGDILKFDEVAGGRIQSLIVSSEEIKDEKDPNSEPFIEYSIAGWSTVE